MISDKPNTECDNNSRPLHVASSACQLTIGQDYGAQISAFEGNKNKGERKGTGQKKEGEREREREERESESESSVNFITHEV